MFQSETKRLFTNLKRPSSPYGSCTVSREKCHFQDENAAIHTVKIVKEIHEEHCNEVEHLV